MAAPLQQALSGIPVTDKTISQWVLLVARAPAEEIEAAIRRGTPSPTLFEGGS